MCGSVEAFRSGQTPGRLHFPFEVFLDALGLVVVVVAREDLVGVGRIRLLLASAVTLRSNILALSLVVRAQHFRLRGENGNVLKTTRLHLAVENEHVRGDTYHPGGRVPVRVVIALLGAFEARSRTIRVLARVDCLVTVEVLVLVSQEESLIALTHSASVVVLNRLMASLLEKGAQACEHRQN